MSHFRRGRSRFHQRSHTAKRRHYLLDKKRIGAATSLLCRWGGGDIISVETHNHHVTAAATRMAPRKLVASWS